MPRHCRHVYQTGLAHNRLNHFPSEFQSIGSASLKCQELLLMHSRAVEISANNAWSVFLLPGQLSPGAAVLTLVGTDSGGTTSTLAFNFTLAAFDLKQAPLLSRATFGATSLRW